MFGDSTVYVRTDHSQVKERIQDVDAMIISKVSMTRELTQENRQLRYTGVLATGYDVIDIEAAKDFHIAATNVPGYGTSVVAQYAIALLLEATSRIGHHTKRVKEREWANNTGRCFWDHSLMELSGRIMGIIEFEHIGRKVAETAQALGMHVPFYDAHTDNDTHAEKVSLGGLLQ